MTVKTEFQAWEAVAALFPTEYKKDEEASKKPLMYGSNPIRSPKLERTKPKQNCGKWPKLSVKKL